MSDKPVNPISRQEYIEKPFLDKQAVIDKTSLAYKEPFKQVPAEREYSQNNQHLAAAVSELLQLVGHLPEVEGIGYGYKKINGKETPLKTLYLVAREPVLSNGVPALSINASCYELKSAGVFVEMQIVKDLGENPRRALTDKDICQEFPVDQRSLIIALREAPDKLPFTVTGGMEVMVNSGKGTLGGWVWDLANDRPALISNRHVLEKAGNIGYVRSTTDHLVHTIRVGANDNWENDFGLAVHHPTSTITHKGIFVPPGIRSGTARVADLGQGMPAVYATEWATLGMHVVKTGRTTGFTEGIISNIITYPKNRVNVTRITVKGGNSITGPEVAFINQGDSGSLLLKADQPNQFAAVGLLYGEDSPIGSSACGNSSKGLALSIQEVFLGLNVGPIPS